MIFCSKAKITFWGLLKSKIGYVLKSQRMVGPKSSYFVYVAAFGLGSLKSPYYNISFFGQRQDDYNQFYFNMNIFFDYKLKRLDKSICTYLLKLDLSYPGLNLKSRYTNI